MTRRIFFSIAAISILILSPANQLFAHGTGRMETRATANGQPNNPQSASQRTPEQLRAQLNAMYDEMEATMKYISDYTIGKNAFEKIGFEGFADLKGVIATSRKQFQGMSDDQLREAGKSLPSTTNLNKITASLHKLRTEPEFKAVLERTEQMFNGRAGKSGSDAAGLNSRSTPSAPSFIKPLCHFDDLNNYPSAKDVAISKGFSLAGEIALLIIPDSLEVPVVGVETPNPLRIAAAIVWGVMEAITIGLEEARSEGVYCQNLAMGMQGLMTDDAQFGVTVLLPRDAGGFADFLKDMVTECIQIAQANGINIQCASARLADANNFYNQGKWVDAYKRYRSAYQNIGSTTCP